MLLPCERLEPPMSQLGHLRLGRASSKPGHVRNAAERGSDLMASVAPATDAIQAPKLESRIRRHELGDFEHLERDDFSSNRHPPLSFCLSMIFSENRYPLFRIML